jgi:ParB-like nuclease domain
MTSCRCRRNECRPCATRAPRGAVSIHNRVLLSDSESKNGIFRRLTMTFPINGSRDSEPNPDSRPNQGLRRVRTRDLVPNPHNWRRHPESQTAALRGVLEEVGYADALLVRELPDGRLELIDGHLRAQTTPDALVPVLILDLNDQEAKLVLLTLDPLAGMAEAEAKQIKATTRSRTQRKRCRAGTARAGRPEAMGCAALHRAK